MIEKVASFDIVVNLFASAGAAEDEDMTRYIVVGVVIAVAVIIAFVVLIVYKSYKKHRRQSDTTSQTSAYEDVSLDKINYKS